MQTFDQSIFGLFEQGLVSYEEALRWATQRRRVQAAGAGHLDDRRHEPRSDGEERRRRRRKSPDSVLAEAVNRAIRLPRRPQDARRGASCRRRRSASASPARHASQEAIDEAVARLREERAIDDARVAEAIARTRDRRPEARQAARPHADRARRHRDKATARQRRRRRVRRGSTTMRAARRRARAQRLRGREHDRRRRASSSAAVSLPDRHRASTPDRVMRPRRCRTAEPVVTDPQFTTMTAMTSNEIRASFLNYFEQQRPPRRARARRSSRPTIRRCSSPTPA